jgi:hypothetical protein
MKMNKWTQVLLGVGLISIPAVASADEKMNVVQTALSSTTLSGYIDTTAIWKFGTGNANMPGRVYDGPDVQDGFNLNVVSLTLNKPLDESEWSSGYNVQLLLGPMASKRGTRSLVGGSSGDVAFNEAVVLLRAPVGNGLDLKIGQFGTFNGYEAFDTYKNPNWSRSFGFFVESSAHTGISGSYKLCDWATVMAGIGNAAGFNNQVDAKASIESKKAYLGMLTLTAPESFGFLQGGSLSVGYTTGDATLAGGTGNVSGTPNPGGRWTQANFYVGASIPTPVEGLSVGVAYDNTTGIGFPDSYANTFAAYLSFQATEKMKLNTRLDWIKTSDGLLYGAATAGSDELFALTSTLDYSLWANTITRLEFRWDTALTGDRPFGGDTAGAPSDKNAVSVGLNVIYMF